MDKLKTVEQNKDRNDAIRAGISSPFWTALKWILEENLKDLQESILTDSSLNEPVPMTKRERMIDWYDMNKRLLNLPGAILESAEEGKVESVDHDPYFSVKEDIKERDYSRP